MLTHQQPVPAADLAQAQELYPAFVDAIERQPPLDDSDDATLRRMYLDTEACLRFVNGDRQGAKRLWRDIIAVETDDKARKLYRRRLTAAEAGASWLPL